MTTLDLGLLLDAVSAGGPSALSATTLLAPAGGPQSGIAPAKYADLSRARSDLGTYVYATRFVDGEPVRTVLIDSAQSCRNRIESALSQAIAEGSRPLALIPRVRVTYTRGDVSESYTDLELPHRVFDAHFRAGTVGGVPTTDFAPYRAARDASPRDASSLLALSPASLLFGAWDASRKARQGRWPSVLTGEIIGVLADQSPDAEPPRKGGARVDPVGMDIYLDGRTLERLALQQAAEMSAKTTDRIVKEARSKPDQPLSASALGFGGIPPTLSQLGLVSCRSVIRSQVVSFASLRQIRFGRNADGDAALRAVLAALGINGLVRANAELFIRASCHLVEAGPTTATVDRRQGRVEQVELPGVEAADAILEEAIKRATSVAGLDWRGQILEVEGNPTVLAGAADETSDTRE
jgi:CRISPR-associated protein Csb1